MPSCGLAPLYRQLELHRSPLWRILVDAEPFLQTYDSRFADSHGPLPREAEKVIDRLVRCGDPRYGLSLLHGPFCNLHVAVPYSCKTRVCPSCVNRRAEVLAHSLAEKLPEVDSRCAKCGAVLPRVAGEEPPSSGLLALEEGRNYQGPTQQFETENLARLREFLQDYLEFGDETPIRDWLGHLNRELEEFATQTFSTSRRVGSWVI